MKVACHCGEVYSFTYDSTCPDCGAEVFAGVQKPFESPKHFSDRMAAFVKQSAQIAALPETRER